MRPFSLTVIVFLSGAAVLAIEILGTRILGPFYGAGLFLWSSLITVTLAALSIGYALGGRWADRGPRYERLGLVLAGAGVWMLLVPWLKTPVLNLSEPLGLRAAVLLTAAILFFPPLGLLGMVSPYAIRLRARRLEEVGRTAGDLYAVSTLASVVSALLTGFFLIPHIGVLRLTLSIGIVLLLAAGISALTARRSAARSVGLLLVLAGSALLLWRAPGRAGTDGDEHRVAVEESAYSDIRVIDWEGARYLLIDGGGHTVVEKGSMRSLFRYAVVMDLAKNFYARPGRLLLIGLGGGSIVRSFAADGWEIDVVEIDPAITKMAREHFALADGDCRVFHMDGRRYLLTHDDRYDLILVDAFGSSAIPFHLVTREAFGLLADHLEPEGILALNVESVGWHDVIINAIAATLGVHFPQVTVLPTTEPPSVLGNQILMASRRPLEFDEDLLDRPFDQLDDSYAHWVTLQRNHAWDNRFRPEPNPALVLTDDLNPVDIWSYRINLAARRILHEEYAWKDLIW